MKKALLFSFILLGSFFSQAQEGRRVDMESVKKEAKKGLNHYLNLIPVGQEAEYGFTSRADFERVEIGDPYQLILIEREGDAVYLNETEFYRVPLKVDQKYVAVITVMKKEGGYEAIDFGAAGLARELEAFEKSKGSSAQKVLIRNTLIRQDYLTTDYASIRTVSNNGRVLLNTATSTPLYDARNLARVITTAQFVAATIEAEVR